VSALCHVRVTELELAATVAAQTFTPA